MVAVAEVAMLSDGTVQSSGDLPTLSSEDRKQDMSDNEFTGPMPNSYTMTSSTLSSDTTITPSFFDAVHLPYPVVSSADLAFSATQLAQIEEVTRRVISEELAKAREEMVQQATLELAKRLRTQASSNRGIL